MQNTATTPVKRIDTFGITWVPDHRRTPDGAKHPSSTRPVKTAATGTTAPVLAAN